MLSVRDAAIAAQKGSLEFQQCSCSVLLALANNALFLYEQVTNIRSRETSDVVTTLTGNPPQNTLSINRTHIEFVLRVQVLHGVQWNLRSINISRNVQFMKHAVSVSCSESLPLFRDITRKKISPLCIAETLCSLYGPQGSRGTDLHLDHGTRSGWGCSYTPRPTFSLEKSPVIIEH